MHFRCDNCGCEQTIYAEKITACPRCGCTKLWWTHFNFPYMNGGKAFHEVLIDMETGETIVPCPCIRDWNKKEENA